LEGKSMKKSTMGRCLILGLFLAGCNGNGLHPAAGEIAPREPYAAQPTGYTVTDLGTLGGTFSYPEGINNAGAQTGRSTLFGDAVLRGFLWQKGRLLDLGAFPAGPNSAGASVNANLQVTGGADGAASVADSNASCLVTSSLDSHAFLWQNGTLIDLGTLGGKTSTGNWINSRGQIIGASQIRETDPNGFVGCGGAPGSQVVRAFLYGNGKMRDLGTLGGFDSAADTINDRGQIGGGSDITTAVDPALGYPHHHPFLWTKGVMTDLGTLGGEFGFTEGVNNNGIAIGLSTLVGEQHAHGFLWQHGVISDLGVLDGDTDSNAQGINTFGQVVGFSGTDEAIRAFVLNRGVMTDLNTLVNPELGFQLFDAQWINDAGEIAVGAMQQNTGDIHAVLLKPSNRAFRGRAGGARLTERLRRYFLRRYGYGRMPVLKHAHDH
jgi:probable HAF family extracellular repeat protein